MSKFKPGDLIRDRIGKKLGPRLLKVVTTKEYLNSGRMSVPNTSDVVCFHDLKSGYYDWGYDINFDYDPQFLVKQEFQNDLEELCKQ